MLPPIAFCRIAFAAVLAAILVIALGWLFRPSAPPVQRRTPSSAGAINYVAALGQADRNLTGAIGLAQATHGDWLPLERLANAYIARARLTGSFEDYAAADAALSRAFADAPKGAGPHQTQAALDFALHRLGPTEKMLDAIDHYAVPAEKEARNEVAGTRGDIAFYRGDYAGAAHLYAAADPDGGDIGILYRVANLQARTGRPDDALATLDRIELEARLPQAQFLADLALRRGAIELQRGQWDKASAHFDRAAMLFPGWWLAEAHRAQMLALAGKPDAAIARFDALARHNVPPEVMDALASLHRAQGNADRATFWADQARNGWNERLRLIPEAAWGHAVEHVLAFGDPALALDLARKDFAARPYGQTATALAWALIANNRPAEALKIIDPVLASAWISAESHQAAAQAHLLLGHTADADREQKAALAINPRAADASAALIWFGH